MARRTLTLRARPSKAWYRSKTVWINGLALVLLAAQSHLELLRAVLPENLYAIAAFGLAMVNAGFKLRGARMAPKHAGDTAMPDRGAPDA